LCHHNIVNLEAGFSWVAGIIWLLAKSTFFMFLYLWIRATFPRFRYDIKRCTVGFHQSRDKKDNHHWE
jgi:NADH:ubiquinone oxidoreductase subunit H